MVLDVFGLFGHFFHKFLKIYDDLRYKALMLQKNKGHYPILVLLGAGGIQT